jgi:hypothetical protein
MPELITRSKLIYQWNELPEVAKRKALEKYWDWNVDDEWWEWVYEGISEGFDGFSGKPNEFDLDRSWFIGFKSLEPNRDELTNLLMKKYIGWRIKDRATYRLYSRAARMIKNGELEISLDGRGRSINLDCAWYVSDYHDDALTIASNYVEEAFLAFAHKCLKRLQDDYDYQTSEQAISEMLEDRSFNDDGTLAD